MQVILEKVRNEDLSDLQKLCRVVYSYYFGDHWTGDGLDRYLHDQFSTERLLSDLSSSTVEFYFVQEGTNRVGFLKINLEHKLEAYNQDSCCEIEKLYILPKWTGMGIGEVSMNMLINSLENGPVRHVFLDVLATNNKALEFYKKQGFVFYAHHRLQAQQFKDDLRDMQRLILHL